VNSSIGTATSGAKNSLSSTDGVVFLTNVVGASALTSVQPPQSVRLEQVLQATNLVQSQLLKLAPFVLEKVSTVLALVAASSHSSTRASSASSAISIALDFELDSTATSVALPASGIEGC
jgi:hypothetical protein